MPKRAMAQVNRVKELLAKVRPTIPRSSMVSARKVYGHNPRCVYCGEPATTTDHVIPRSEGGHDLGGNLVPACKGCNAAKGSQPLADFLASRPGSAELFVKLAEHAHRRHLKTARKVASAPLLPDSPQ